MRPTCQRYLVLGIQRGFGQTEHRAPHPDECNLWQKFHPKHMAQEHRVSSDLCSQNQCSLCAGQANPEQTSDKQRQLEHSSFQTSHSTARVSSCVPCSSPREDPKSHKTLPLHNRSDLSSVFEVSVLDVLCKPVLGPVQIFLGHRVCHPGQSLEKDVVFFLVSIRIAGLPTGHKLFLFIIKVIPVDVSVLVGSPPIIRILSQLLHQVK